MSVSQICSKQKFFYFSLLVPILILLILFNAGCGSGNGDHPTENNITPEENIEEITPEENVIIDNVPPTIISTNPTDGITNLAINDSISVVFSEQIDESTISSATFRISIDGIDVSGGVSYTDTTAIFTPSNDLVYSTTYTAIVSINVKDLSGNNMASDYVWTFKTEIGQVEIPTVIAISPIGIVLDIPTDSLIIIEFSKDMDSSSITTDTFLVNDGSNNISGTVTYNDSEKTANFTPEINLSYHIEYTTKITTNVKDLAGNSLVDDYIWTFTLDISAPDPVANAGFDRTGIVTRDINNPSQEEISFLIASGSSGNEWAWSVANQSVSGVAKFTSQNTQTTGFYAEKAGEYTLQLEAGNGQGKTATDTCIVKLIEDMDNDGLSDSEDLDKDGDGFPNNEDAFPDDKASHYDENLDEIGNYYTNDVDNDSIDDIYDEFPLDSNKTVYETYAENKEINESNQNDGITVSEDAGNPPKNITGYIFATDNRVDIDYYELTFDTVGRYSVVLIGAVSAMQPSIAILENTGTPVATTTANMPLEAGSTAISVLIPDSGTYYLNITDSSGTSDSTWVYNLKLFPDEDVDGVPDDLEIALDSSNFTADSDGDGISDYIEINLAIKDWTICDKDVDGLPCWWDLDSDGDKISDKIEYYTENDRSNLSAAQLALFNDSDEDKIFNFLDSDSDENGITDLVEVGLNFANPLDSDLDDIPDYLDFDDDGDGLWDVNEKEGYRLVALEPSETPEADSQPGGSMRLSTAENITLEIENVCQADNQVLLKGLKLPSIISNTWIIIQGIGNVLNLNPDTADVDGLHFTWPSGISSGIVKVFLAYDNQHTNSLDILVPEENTPILTGYSIDTLLGQVTFTGQNLDYSLSVNFTGAGISIDNSFGSSTSFTVDIPSDAIRGSVTVTNSVGESNSIWVDLARLLSGEIVLPVGSIIDITKLDVSWSVNPDDEVNPDPNGYFITTADISGPTTVTALLEDSNSTEELPIYAVYLEAIALKDDVSVILNSQNTAIALIWNAIGVSGLVAESSLPTARNILANLQEIKNLGDILETKLVGDPSILNKSDSDIVSKAKDAILEAGEAIQNNLSDGTLIDKSLSRSLSRFRSESATVIPEEVDDIKVYERGDTGNVNVENDTQLYLSAQIIASDGTVLQSHISGLKGMIGPQGYGLLFVASSKEYDHPKGQNCTVQIITAGFDKEYIPQTSAPYEIRKYLLIRTAVERVLWPPISSIITVPCTPSDLSDIILSHAPNVANVFLQDSVSAGMKELILILWKDIAELPPGPITKALARKWGKNITEKILAKMAAKIGAKFIPGIGQIQLAYEIGGYINKGVNVIKTVSDLSTIDSVIEFNVEFPLQIKEVIPNKVRPDGKNKIFIIEGKGFSEIIRGWFFKTTFRPEVTFIDADDFEIIMEPFYISQDGNKMKVNVPGYWLSPYTEGPIKVKVHHPTDKDNAFVEKNSAIEIVDKVQISSVSPSSGGIRIAATIYGAGFSNIISYNEVTVGSKTALISQATDTSLKIVIPGSLEPGIHEIKARNYFNEIWSEWSNPVDFEIIEGKIKMTVTDNGSVKDDAFALYVDGIYQGTMYASYYSYSQIYTIGLSSGIHTAMLLGIEAPDDIGTYQIDFEGVENITGDPLEGRDLVPGVSKYYTFNVSDTEVARRMFKVTAFPCIPKILCYEKKGD